MSSLRSWYEISRPCWKDEGETQECHKKTSSWTIPPLATLSSKGNGNSTYRNLEIHEFLGKRRHFIIEAKLIFPDVLGRKHKVSLSFLDSTQNHLPIGGYHRVIDIERTAGLNLTPPINDVILLLNVASLTTEKSWTDAPQSNTRSWNSDAPRWNENTPSRWLQACRSARWPRRSMQRWPVDQWPKSQDAS